MTELRLGDQLVRYDRDATLAAYAQLPQGWAEECGCSTCRNFIAVRAQAFPDAFRTFLSELGIDANKEGEAIYYGPIEGNLHFYGGWFYLVGELIEAAEKLKTITWFVLSCATDSGPRRGLPVLVLYEFCAPPAIFGSRIAAVEFTTLLPWVLDVDPISAFRRRSTAD